jgi:Arc/MetJ-type ribon-helix-helix transcriptional regulator
MTDQGRKITFRATEEEIDTIQILAEKNGYDNISDFIRTGLNLFIQAQMAPQNMKSLVIQVPIGVYDRAERLVKAGEAATVPDEIVRAFEAHIETKIERKVIESQRLERLEKGAMDRDQRRNIFDNVDRSFSQ